MSFFICPLLKAVPLVCPEVIDGCVIDSLRIIIG